MTKIWEGSLQVKVRKFPHDDCAVFLPGTAHQSGCETRHVVLFDDMGGLTAHAGQGTLPVNFMAPYREFTDRDGRIHNVQSVSDSKALHIMRSL
jgi:RecB family endonuclease NucS